MTVLIVVLVALLGGYIYFGMYLAKQNDVTTVTETETPPPAPVEMTPEQKMAILQSLQDDTATSTPAPTIGERQKVLESLSADSEASSSGMTEAQKLDILNSLNAQ